MIDSRAATDTLAELSRLEAASRAPRSDVSFPLLVFGFVFAGSVPVALLIGREDLGRYFLPMNLLGGFLCARHYRRRGVETGLQAPLLAWLAVVLGATMAGALCSFAGRELNWPALNLAGPMVAMELGYALLAAWARSTLLLVAVPGIAVASAAIVSSASGDTAVALQTGTFAAVQFALAAVSYISRKKAS